MVNTLKKLIAVLKGPDKGIITGKSTVRSTTCPPPGSTITKTVWIFCFYTDSQGNSGWCVLS